MEQTTTVEKEGAKSCDHCFWHRGRFSVLRIIIGLILLFIVFGLGFAAGRITGFERGYGRMHDGFRDYRGYYMMRDGYGEQYGNGYGQLPPVPQNLPTGLATSTGK